MWLIFFFILAFFLRIYMTRRRIMSVCLDASDHAKNNTLKKYHLEYKGIGDRVTFINACKKKIKFSNKKKSNKREFVTLNLYMSVRSLIYALMLYTCELIFHVSFPSPSIMMTAAASENVEKLAIFHFAWNNNSWVDTNLHYFFSADDNFTRECFLNELYWKWLAWLVVDEGG